MPTVAEAFQLALQFLHAGDASQAERLCRQILEADSQHADAIHVLGLVALQTGRAVEAIGLLESAAALSPWVSGYHLNLGAAYQADGRLAEAVACYQRALQISPDSVDCHSNLGDALRLLGRPQEAERHCRQALALNPGRAEAMGNLGNALLAQDRVVEAREAFEAALKINPTMAAVRNGLGIALQRQQRFDEAVRCFQDALGQAPDFVEAHCNLGLTLDRLGRHEEASLCHRRALQLQPDNADAHFNLGNSQRDLGNLDGALASFEQTLRLNPCHADAHWNRALIWLLLGDFERGWPEYEWRLELPGRSQRLFAQPVWNGLSLEGKTILIHAEQGLGDTLQFIRYAALVKERGARVVVECQRPLATLLKGVAGIDELVVAGSPLGPFDFHIHLLSLPKVFRTGLADIPASVPYLSTDPQLALQWREELRQVDGFKIGIVWQCDPVNPPWGRAVPLEQFGTLAHLPGVRLISLQKGPGIEQLAAVTGRFPVLDWGERLDESAGPFMDTAAVMTNLDLVISCDTAPAHLAGALGVPVWLALPAAPDWRWLLHRQDSPWYPSMRLFRQSRSGIWDDVFERMTESLDDLLAKRA